MSDSALVWHALPPHLSTKLSECGMQTMSVNHLDPSEYSSFVSYRFIYPCPRYVLYHFSAVMSSFYMNLKLSILLKESSSESWVPKWYCFFTFMPFSDVYTFISVSSKLYHLVVFGNKLLFYNACVFHISTSLLVAWLIGSSVRILLQEKVF